MELIVVVVVLGILASIAIVGYKTVVDKSLEAKQKMRMTQILKEAKILYTQRIYTDALYPWSQAVADAVDDLPTYSLNAWTEGTSATGGGSNLNAATNGWTVQTDTGSGVYSVAPNDIVTSTSGAGIVYIASALSSTQGVFGMISATTAPVVWTASCSGSSCDASSATAGPPAGGAYAPGTTVVTTTTTTTTTTVPVLSSVEYLVVAGGGGASGGAGGGGGGGGFRTASGFSVSAGVPITVTVGAGGVGGGSWPAGGYAASGAGQNSVFSSIVSIGGGSSGGQNDVPTNGGSGGGGGGGTNGPSQQNAGVGTSGQGNSGAAGIQNDRGGGGGGAGAAGSALSGGNGLASSITGVSVTYAGGGGAGGYTTFGYGGTGGGGNGTAYSDVPTSGVANLGGGGGGGGESNPHTGFQTAGGGNGGSGIVIIKYASSFANLSSISAGLTYTLTTSGGFKVYRFTAGTGTVTI